MGSSGDRPVRAAVSVEAPSRGPGPGARCHPAELPAMVEMFYFCAIRCDVWLLST